MLFSKKSRKKAYVSGGLHVRSSWKLFQKAQELQKEVPADKVEEFCKFESDLIFILQKKVLKDVITFGLGLFALLISLLPPTYQWVAEFIGFRADREEGEGKKDCLLFLF